MAEPTYEYRVVCGDGEEFERYGSDLARAEFHAERQADHYPDEGPHLVQRRVVGEWEKVYEFAFGAEAEEG